MQDDKREYTPPVLVPMGTIRSLTRTRDVMGSDAATTGTADVGTKRPLFDLAEEF